MWYRKKKKIKILIYVAFKTWLNYLTQHCKVSSELWALYVLPFQRQYFILFGFFNILLFEICLFLSWGAETSYKFAFPLKHAFYGIIISQINRPGKSLLWELAGSQYKKRFIQGWSHEYSAQQTKKITTTIILQAQSFWLGILKTGKQNKHNTDVTETGKE